MGDQSSWPHEWLLCYLCSGVWLCQPVSPLTPLLLFSKVLNSALFLDCFFWGVLVSIQNLPCLYSTPFCPAATSVPNSGTCSVSPVTVLTGCLSPFSLGHLFHFCSYPPGCCFSLQPALESHNSLLNSFASSLFIPRCINCPWIVVWRLCPEGHLKWWSWLLRCCFPGKDRWGNMIWA